MPEEEEKKATATFLPPNLYRSEAPIQRKRQPQSPPGVSATQNEVDLLTDKILQLKISKADFISVQWTPRESELLANQSVAMHAQTTSAKRLAEFYQQQLTGYQNTQHQGFQTRGQQPIPPQPNQYSQAPRLPSSCFACMKTGHGKYDCPTIYQLYQNRWCYWDMNRRLHWGTIDIHKDES